MKQDVKELRKIIGGYDGVWVRAWNDGEIWVGIDKRKYIKPGISLSDLVDLLKANGYGCSFEDRYSRIITVTKLEGLE